MKASRLINHAAQDTVSSWTDQELCMKIRAELSGWARERLMVLTTFPVSAPDWINNERQLSRLESFVMGRAGVHIHREELGRIAGDFNPRPTARQRCEAVLSTVLRAKADVIATS